MLAGVLLPRLVYAFMLVLEVVLGFIEVLVMKVELVIVKKLNLKLEMKLI